jgi:hypothetical protein
MIGIQRPSFLIIAAGDQPQLQGGRGSQDVL